MLNEEFLKIGKLVQEGIFIITALKVSCPVSFWGHTGPRAIT